MAEKLPTPAPGYMLVEPDIENRFAQHFEAGGTGEKKLSKGVIRALPELENGGQTKLSVSKEYFPGEKREKSVPIKEGLVIMYKPDYADEIVVNGNLYHLISQWDVKTYFKPKT
jgi:co-chaperonin GroES (HSP10)